MSNFIHPYSSVSPEVILGNNVTIGPFCVVEGNVRIGSGSILRSHVTIGPNTELGEGNDIYPYCALGMDPQDLKFKGDQATELVIGNCNIIREGCTMHRGTEHSGITTIGNNSLFMTGSHVAHDCRVGDNNIFANNTTLAGHVEVGDFCNIGAFSAIHQFCRVGSYSFMGGFTVATLDVLPYIKTVGARDVKCYGINNIGLRRREVPESIIKILEKAYRILFHSKLLREEAIDLLLLEFGDIKEVKVLVDFIRSSSRGVHRG